MIKVKHEKSTSLTFVKSNARSESAKYYLSCIIFSQTKSLKRTKVRWLQTQTIERHITCILLDIESRSLRISCRFFVPRMFLNVVWASSLIGSEFKKKWPRDWTKMRQNSSFIIIIGIMILFNNSSSSYLVEW